MNKHLNTITLAAAALAGFAASNASAWTSIGSWGTNNITIRASSVSFPAGSSYRTALGTVTSRIFNNPSNFWITQSYDDGSLGFNNGQNEVWFSADSAHSPAVCYTWTSWWTGDIVEADVVFWNGIAYTSSMNKTSLTPYGGGSRPFQTTCMHEYGHACGLGHENDEYTIMGQDWDHIHLNGSTCRSYLGEDACDGLVALYGAVGSGFEDVSLSHWEWTGASGEYSTHGLCKMFSNSTGAELGWTSFNGQRRYNVTKGVTYRVELTFENNGRTTQNPSVGFYISTNSTISTGDTLVRTVTPSVGRGDVMTTWYTVTIPSNLTSGTTYYLGAIIDRTGAIAETDESNNAAYHIIRIN
jgi:hypothetical protein